jgi:hypothetical protein
MTPRIPENIRTLFPGWSLVTILGSAIPPRDPNDDEDYDDAAEGEDEGEDEEEDDEPAVIREPDEDE